MCSRFEGVKLEAQVEPFEIHQMCIEDTHPNKVNLGLGMYNDDSGSPCVLPVVRKVEQLQATDETLLHDYLPVLGLDKFSSASVRFLLGDDNPAIAEGRAFGVQTLSGSGSIRVGAELLFKTLHYDTVYYSDPTFCNHARVFNDVGFTCLREYRYWDAKALDLDFDGLVEDLRLAPENSVIVLHVCAHNPTGIDPTLEQWKTIADIMEERKLFPFFDSAYQGFASGDLDRDVWAVRFFLQRGFELICAQSYAKNFSLYNERVGTLTLVVRNAAVVPAVRSQLTWIINDIYFNPPAHGAKIVARILTDEQLFDEWKKEIKEMSSRLVKMRRALKAELIKLETPGNWEHIERQIGMFSYTGLTARQVRHLREEYHVYLLRCGRLNVCGLNSGNVEYVARAIHGAVKKYPAEELPEQVGN